MRSSRRLQSAFACASRLAAEIGKIVRSEALRSRCQAIGCEALNPTTPSDFADLVRSEVVRWSRIVADSGARVD